MLIHGILNPQINYLLARVRHTNMLVIADRGFPFWPMIETLDISLVDDIPTVLQVFQAIRPNFDIGEIIMAQEFVNANTPEVCKTFAAAIGDIPLCYKTHGVESACTWHDRFDPDRRYDSIRQHDPHFRPSDIKQRMIDD